MSDNQTDPQTVLRQQYLGHRASEMALGATRLVVVQTIRNLTEFRQQIEDELRGESAAARSCRAMGEALGTDLGDKSFGSALVEGANLGTAHAKVTLHQRLQPAFDFMRDDTGFHEVGQGAPARSRPGPDEGARTSERRHSVGPAALERPPSGEAPESPQEPPQEPPAPPAPPEPPAPAEPAGPRLRPAAHEPPSPPPAPAVPEVPAAEEPPGKG